MNDIKVSKKNLKTLLSRELNNTKYLKKIKNITEYLIKQAIKESNLEVYAKRYEKHINDSSVGIFQILTSTLEWLGYTPKNVFECYFPNIQVKYALKYLDFLYGKFPEIHNPKERLKMAFSAYNMGRGNVNKGLKIGRSIEEIYYDAENTIQGYWSTYDNMIKNVEKNHIVSKKNSEINKKYIDFIFNI